MVTISVLTMFGLGLVASVLLVIASRVFFVKENPKVEAALQILPGANCGGCGFAGCEGYAKAVVMNPEVPANRCCAAPKEASQALAELTGKTVAESEPMVAMRRCDIHGGGVALRYEYHGVHSCAAAHELRGGTNKCFYSCLGFGDCVAACPFGAISIVDGLCCVNVQRCTGCGNCSRACPRHVIELIPKSARVCVPCNTQLKAKSVMEICKAGCIKCAKCLRTCPVKAISMVNGIIHIDGALCRTAPDCGMPCVKGCARHIIRPIDLLGRGAPAAPAEEETAKSA